MMTRVLVVEDDPSLRESLEDTLRLSGFLPATANDGVSALRLLAEQPIDVVLTDVQMDRMDGMSLLEQVRVKWPDLKVVMMTAFATVQQAVDAMRLGASDYLVKPFEAEVLVAKLAELIPTDTTLQNDHIAVDPVTIELFDTAKRVAASDVSVLLEGESGTGKEVLAQFIHQHSPRSGKPFVAVNCAAIPENMLEAMLFGYEKGAFTGAYKACPGKFERAQEGTLFLDEIAEMSPGLQAKLLRVLQEREVERLGASQAIPLDLRVLAATNSNLPNAVAAGEFREDLYYRLAVFPLNLPPLRQRLGDLDALCKHLLARAAQQSGRRPPSLSSAAVELLRAHDWPGNVRELDNVMQRANVLCIGERIEPDHLKLFETRMERPAATTATDPNSGLGEDLKDRERRLILEALENEGGNRKAAAERLGIAPRTLRHKIQLMRTEGQMPPAA